MLNHIAPIQTEKMRARKNSFHGRRKGRGAGIVLIRVITSEVTARGIGTIGYVESASSITTFCCSGVNGWSMRPPGRFQAHGAIVPWHGRDRSSPYPRGGSAYWRSPHKRAHFDNAKR